MTTTSSASSFFRPFFRMTLTIALQNLIVYGVNLADNIMIGAYSESAMSGVALVNQIQFLLQMLVSGAGEGLAVLASRAWGRGDIDEVKSATSVGMRFGLGASALLFFAVLLFPESILGLLTPEKAVIAEGVAYLRIICYTYPVFALTNMLLASLRSVETVKIGFFVSLSTLVINVCLNGILIYGRLGAPELGVVGAAIATLISRIAELVIILVYLAVGEKKLHLKLRDFASCERTCLVSYTRVSIPVMLSGGMWGIAQTVQTGIIGHLGESAIGANSIAATVFSVLTVVTYGSASAAAVLIGKAIGEGKDEKTLGHYASRLQLIFLAIGIATGALLFLFKDFIIGFYRITPETKELALAFMTVLSVTVVGTAYQMATLTGIVRGGGDTSFTLKNDSFFMWVIVIPSALAAAFLFELSPIVVFICLKCDQILKCAVAAVKVNFGRWIKRV